LALNIEMLRGNERIRTGLQENQATVSLVLCKEDTKLSVGY